MSEIGGHRGQIVAFCNQKGGVGKTTSVINLGTALAASDQRVLIVDLDPQGNASTGLGCALRDRTWSISQVLQEEIRLNQSIRTTAVDQLDLSPATTGLFHAESYLGQDYERLRQILNPIRPQYDYILIDCSPSLGTLTLNALTAADKVFIPLQTEFFALEGVNHLIQTIASVKRDLNPALEIEGVVLTMYDKRNNLSDIVAKDVRDCFGSLVYETIIPRNVRLSEAPSHGKPILLYDIHSSGANAYIALAAEFLNRQYRTEKRKVA